MAHLNLEILDTKTSVRKIVEDATDWGDLTTAEYNYGDGNCACDCTRATLVHGESANEPCGEGRYLIKATVRETGAVLFDELTNKE